MKKIFLIAFAFAGFSTVTTAQEARVGMTPASTKAESDRDASVKMQTRAKMKSDQQSNWVDPNMENYKKVGLNEAQITNISASVKNLEQKKMAIQSNRELTEEQRQAGLDAVERERRAILQKNMDEGTYKKYTQVSQTDQKAKSVKSTATPQ